MPAPRLLKALYLLVLAAAAPAQPATPHAAARATLEVRLAAPCSTPAAGRPVKDPDAAGSICLARPPFLATSDIESAEIHHNAAGHPTILLTFHHDAAMRELQVTLKNVGNRVGIVLNGRLISAPHISSASRLLFLDGNFTQAQAEALVDDFNRQARKP